MKTVGYVDENGKYHVGEDKPMPHDVDRGFKDWSHTDQRKRHAGDILQPYTADGRPSREFAEVYGGEVAKRYFTEEEIIKAERSLNE